MNPFASCRLPQLKTTSKSQRLPNGTTGLFSQRMIDCTGNIYSLYKNGATDHHNTASQPEHKVQDPPWRVSWRDEQHHKSTGALQKSTGLSPFRLTQSESTVLNQSSENGSHWGIAIDGGTAPCPSASIRIAV